MPTVSVSFPVARKLHGCTSCGRPIVKGERYRRWTGTSDMWFGLATAKECAGCCERYERGAPMAVASQETQTPEGDAR